MGFVRDKTMVIVEVKEEEVGGLPHRFPECESGMEVMIRYSVLWLVMIIEGPGGVVNRNHG